MITHALFCSAAPSSPIISSRITNFCALPVAVSGKSDDADVARHLVVRDLAAAEVADLCSSSATGRAASTTQAQTSSPYFASGTPNTCTSCTLRVAQQVLLDLARIDVLAAADQHVLDAADDVAVALGVDRREVAGVHPAGGVDRLARCASSSSQ